MPSKYLIVSNNRRNHRFFQAILITLCISLALTGTLLLLVHLGKIDYSLKKTELFIKNKK